MTKPDDIPQDIWGAANVRCDLTPESSLRIAIARAIMEEREACAQLIDEGYDREGIKTKGDKCTHGQYSWEYCDPCASAAIRNRGA